MFEKTNGIRGEFAAMLRLRKYNGNNWIRMYSQYTYLVFMLRFNRQDIQKKKYSEK